MLPTFTEAELRALKYVDADIERAYHDERRKAKTDEITSADYEERRKAKTHEYYRRWKEKLTPDKREKLRAYNRNYYQANKEWLKYQQRERYANRTPEQIERDRAKQKARYEKTKALKENGGA